MSDDEIAKIIEQTIARTKDSTELFIRKMFDERLGKNLLSPDEHIEDHKNTKVLGVQGADESIRFISQKFRRVEDQEEFTENMSWVKGVKNNFETDKKNARRVIVVGIVAWVIYLLRGGIVDAGSSFIEMLKAKP